MHAAHEGIRIRVDREHGIRLHQLAGLGVRPCFPDAGQTPRLAVGSTKASPNAAQRLPIRLEENGGRDDAQLAARPCILVAVLPGDILGAGIVRVHRLPVSRPRRIGRRVLGHKPPLPEHEFGPRVGPTLPDERA